MSSQGSGLSFTSFFGDRFKVVEHQNHIFPESGFVTCSIIESSRGSLICVPVTEGTSSDGDSYLTVTEVDIPKATCDGFVEERIIIQSQSSTSGLQLEQLELSGASRSELLDLPVVPIDSAAPASGSSLPEECSSQLKEAATRGNDEVTQKVFRKGKQKGGWPKGKKRKKCLIETAAPKSPATGYVLFLNSRRKEMKMTGPEIPFAEVTKMLGNEWTNLPAQEKKGYLKKAEEEKCRYREELRQYQQSDAYQALTSKKKFLHGGETEGTRGEENGEKSSSSLLIHDIEEEDFRRELYCVVCDKLFNSLHNKREHLYGKQHLSNITGVTQTLSSDEKDLPNKSQSQEENLVSAWPSTHFHLKDSVTSVSTAMSLVTSLSIERLDEIKYLTLRSGNLQHHKNSLEKDILLLEEVQKKRERDLETIQDEGKNLSSQLLNLRMVPTLFGIINF